MNIKSKLTGFCSYKGSFGQKIKKIVPTVFVYAFLIGITYVFLFPFIYMLVTSFKSYFDIYDSTVVWVPRSIEWKNYLVAFKLLNFGKHFSNSAILTALCTLGHMLSCSFIAYGFARYKFIGKGFWFFILLLAIVIPPQTIIVPSYILYSNLGWLRSYLPLIVPCFFGLGLNGALFIYIFRQFFMGLPKDIENAAKIDGCNYLQTYFRIVIPMAKSSFLVVFILSLVWHWNDYYEPRIYATGEELMLLPQKTYQLIEYVNDPPLEMLTGLISGEGNPINSATLMAGMVICIFPVLIIFTFVQTQFMEGIERTGITGE